MTERKWTPGPWRILNESDCHSDGDGNTVSMAIGKRDNHAFALAMHPYSDRIVEANANLIAAAPELYEALEDLIAYGHETRGDRVIAAQNAARAALAKARGEA